MLNWTWQRPRSIHSIVICFKTAIKIAFHKKHSLNRQIRFADYNKVLLSRFYTLFSHLGLNTKPYRSILLEGVINEMHISDCMNYKALPSGLSSHVDLIVCSLQAVQWIHYVTLKFETRALPGLAITTTTKKNTDVRVCQKKKKWKNRFVAWSLNRMQLTYFSAQTRNKILLSSKA